MSLFESLKSLNIFKVVVVMKAYPLLSPLIYWLTNKRRTP